MSLSSGCPWRQDSRGELSRVKSVASGCRGPVEPRSSYQQGRRKNDTFNVLAMQLTQYQPQLLFESIYFYLFIQQNLNFTQP